MPNKTAAELSRDELLAMIAAFINQRPGLEFANYGDVSLYRSESRSITADGHDARALLAAVSWRSGITADHIRAALQSGRRLTLSDSGRLDYCTGQYFPTEYRRAACRVLAGLLWDYWRDAYTERPPSGVIAYPSGDFIRKIARRELSRRITSRYFN